MAYLRSLGHAFGQNAGGYETLPSSSTRAEQTRADKGKGKQSLQVIMTVYVYHHVLMFTDVNV